MATNNNNKVLNVPNLRFPGFEGEWKKCKLGQIAAIAKGNGIQKNSCQFKVLHVFYMGNYILNINLR